MILLALVYLLAAVCVLLAWAAFELAGEHLAEKEAARELGLSHLGEDPAVYRGVGWFFQCLALLCVWSAP